MNLSLCFKPTGKAESTDRTPVDCFHFGAVFFGLILAATGVVILSTGLHVFGLLLAAFGLAYFRMAE